MVKAMWLKTKLVGWVCGLLVVSHLLNVLLGGLFYPFGILPRDINSLPYVLTSPWIHGGVSHLINNLIGLAIFSWLCLLRSVRLYVWSSFFIIVAGGLLVWCFGRPAMHIGASGWIFGLWSLSIALAWFDRNAKNIFIAVLVVLFYGGMIYGVLPQEDDVSFEAHFFGAVTGVIAAWMSTWTIFKRKRIN